jgi:hypothetical protein
VFREGANHNRRGNNRRASFGGRKPPCLFFPAGKCKNGLVYHSFVSIIFSLTFCDSDDCRFPHVTPEGPIPHHGYFSGRGSGSRPRGHINGNGFGAIDEKLGGTSIRDVCNVSLFAACKFLTLNQDTPSRASNGAEGTSRSQSTDPGSRPRFSHGMKVNHAVNGVRTEKSSSVKQRVPNADEFPVLAGSTTPPSRSPGLNGSLPHVNGHSGPTAAQVLQAPPPARRDSAPKESILHDTTPDSGLKVAQPVKVGQMSTYFINFLSDFSCPRSPSQKRMESWSILLTNIRRINSQSHLPQ